MGKGPGNPTITKSTPGIFECDLPIAFWLSWSGDQVQVSEQFCEQSQLLELTSAGQSISPITSTKFLKGNVFSRVSLSFKGGTHVITADLFKLVHLGTPRSNHGPSLLPPWVKTTALPGTIKFIRFYFGQ